MWLYISANVRLARACQQGNGVHDVQNSKFKIQNANAWNDFVIMLDQFRSRACMPSGGHCPVALSTVDPVGRGNVWFSHLLSGPVLRSQYVLHVRRTVLNCRRRVLNGRQNVSIGFRRASIARRFSSIGFRRALNGFHFTLIVRRRAMFGRRLPLIACRLLSIGLQYALQSCRRALMMRK